MDWRRPRLIEGLRPNATLRRPAAAEFAFERSPDGPKILLLPTPLCAKMLPRIGLSCSPLPGDVEEKKEEENR